MKRIVRIEQDGFTTCVIDTFGASHCFRIDKEIGAELVDMVTANSAKGFSVRGNWGDDMTTDGRTQGARLTDSEANALWRTAIGEAHGKGRCHPTEYDRTKVRSIYAAGLAARAEGVPVAWRDVEAERQRQVSAEGWTPEHDDEHHNGAMALAALSYAHHSVSRRPEPPMYWPWDADWWKPSTPRRDLVKAGALILAEIERLDRAAPAPAQSMTEVASATREDAGPRPETTEAVLASTSVTPPAPAPDVAKLAGELRDTSWGCFPLCSRLRHEAADTLTAQAQRLAEAEGLLQVTQDKLRTAQMFITPEQQPFFDQSMRDCESRAKGTKHG